MERLRKVFILRIWREGGSDARWRGVIEALDDRRQRYFSELEAANEFVRTYLAEKTKEKT